MTGSGVRVPVALSPGTTRREQPNPPTAWPTPSGEGYLGRLAQLHTPRSTGGCLFPATSRPGLRRQRRVSSLLLVHLRPPRPPLGPALLSRPSLLQVLLHRPQDLHPGGPLPYHGLGRHGLGLNASVVGMPSPPTTQRASFDGEGTSLNTRSLAERPAAAISTADRPGLRLQRQVHGMR